MNNELEKMEGSSRGLIYGTIPEFALRKWGKPQKELRKAGVRAESWPQALPKKSRHVRCPSSMEPESSLPSHNNLPLESVVSQLKPFQPLISYFFKLYLNVVYT
jgi:hypothetical protein